jgi:hypothetical protein
MDIADNVIAFGGFTPAFLLVDPYGGKGAPPETRVVEDDSDDDAQEETAAAETPAVENEAPPSPDGASPDGSTIEQAAGPDAPQH